jgi:hypothetical protein
MVFVRHGDKVMKVWLLVRVFPQDTSHPLDELELRFCASDVDTYLGVRYVDALVEQFWGDEYAVIGVGKLIDALANDLILLSIRRGNLTVHHVHVVGHIRERLADSFGGLDVHREHHQLHSSVHVREILLCQLQRTVEFRL